MKKSINIKDFVSAVNYQIGEGYEYQWDCYGLDAFGLDWCRIDLSASAAIIYDTKTQEVYEMSVWDCRDCKVYRWIKPEYIKIHKKEAKSRGVKFNIAIDTTKYEDTTPSRLLGHLKRLRKRRVSSFKPKPNKVWID
jgi:hypothetical protein